MNKELNILYQKEELTDEEIQRWLDIDSDMEDR